MSLAWHTAMLTRIALSRKKNGQWADMPKLEDMMSAGGKPRRRFQTPEERWHALAGAAQSKPH